MVLQLSNTFTFTATDSSGDAVTANSSDSGNGGSAGADAVYQINSGLDVFVQSAGWGSGTWGASWIWLYNCFVLLMLDN